MKTSQSEFKLLQSLQRQNADSPVRYNRMICILLNDPESTLDDVLAIYREAKSVGKINTQTYATLVSKFSEKINLSRNFELCKYMYSVIPLLIEGTKLGYIKEEVYQTVMAALLDEKADKLISSLLRPISMHDGIEDLTSSRSTPDMF